MGEQIPSPSCGCPPTTYTNVNGRDVSFTVPGWEPGFGLPRTPDKVWCAAHGWVAFSEGRADA